MFIGLRGKPWQKQENEWRLLWRNDETKLKTHRFALTEKAIRAIYLGLASSNTTETELEFELYRNFPKAKLYKATKYVGAFAFEFHEI